MHPLNQPEVTVSFAAERIKNGQVADSVTRDLISKLLMALQPGRNGFIGEPQEEQEC